MSLCYLSLMPTLKWPSFSPLGATLVIICGWGGNRYSRRGDVLVQVGIGWIRCSTNVILFLCGLRVDLSLWTYVPRFDLRPGVVASLNMYHETVHSVCLRWWHSLLRKREFTSVTLMNPSNPSWEITGHFGCFTAQLEVLAVCLKQ